MLLSVSVCTTSRFWIWVRCIFRSTYGRGIALFVKLGGSCSDGREWFGLGVHIYVCNPPSDLLSNLTVNTTKNDDAHNKMMPQAALQREKKCYLLGMLLGRRTAHNGPKKQRAERDHITILDLGQLVEDMGKSIFEFCGRLFSNQK